MYVPSRRSHSALISETWLEIAPELPQKMLYKHLQGPTAANLGLTMAGTVRLLPD